MMGVYVKRLESFDAIAWDRYVFSHPEASLYHLSGWRSVIKEAYGHKCYYLMAVERNGEGATNSLSEPRERIVGVLPLVHLKLCFFGSRLISVPFFDLGGILADHGKIAARLLWEAVKVGQDLRAKNIELRHEKELPFVASDGPFPWLALGASDAESVTSARHELEPEDIMFQTRSHKTRMILGLPESSAILMKSFKSKLRSQIRKPVKEGLISRVGGRELLDDFYDVFSTNMRDLGSPVHSKGLVRKVLKVFSGSTRIVMVYRERQPVACSLVIGFNEVLENPWASALREYSRFSPNMLLYWTMLEYACDNGYRYFDFGRSSPDEGTFKFKEQWGAVPNPLHWHYISLNGSPVGKEGTEKSKFGRAIQYWQKLPVPVTKIIGPMIRRHISL